MGEICAHRSFVVKPDGGDHLEDLVEDGRMVLKLNLKNG
jgi:hypothetical protein